MKYAVISDIHGNHPALLKVLEDARKKGVDGYILAGDYCLSGAWPNDCIETMKALPDKQIIRGNEERYLENLIGKEQSNWTDGQMQISYWNYRNIQTENLEYILSLPQALDFECNGVKVHVAHASDTFIGEYEFRKFGPGVLAKKYADVDVSEKILRDDIQKILDNDPEFQDKIRELEEGVYIFGHSHVQWSYKAKDRNLYLINPGSCGLPLDGVKDSIPYCILTISDTGMVELEEIRVTFDMMEYVEKLKMTTQYMEANVWTKVISKELLTAKEHIFFFLQFVEQYAKNIGDSRRPFSVETWEAAYEAWEATYKKEGNM